MPFWLLQCLEAVCDIYYITHACHVNNLNDYVNIVNYGDLAAVSVDGPQ